MATSNRPKLGRKKEQWVRSFTVSDPITHPKGFTIYKVTYMGFLINKPEETIEVTVWKRYNDFKKLYKALFTIHQQMRRPETFPPFAKAKLFGRFDEEVIEERRKSTLKLLEFTATKSYLVNSQYFVKFFEGGEKKVSEEKEQPVRKNILVPEILTPQLKNQEKTETIEPPQVSSGANSPNLARRISENPSSDLGGIWLHRQDEEDDPLSELRGLDIQDSQISFDGDDDDDDRTTFSEDSVPSTPLPQVQDLSFFDPLADAELPVESNDGLMSHSSSWLFEAMDMCAGLQEKEVPIDSFSTASSDTPSDGITLNFPRQPVNHVAPDYADAGTSSHTTTTENTSHLKAEEKDLSGESRVPETRRDDHHAKSMARAYLNCIRAQQAAERDEQLGAHGGIVDSRNMMVQQLPIGVQNEALHEIASREKTNINLSVDTVSTMDLGGEEDYLYKAANHIQLALESESTGNYKSAFTYYKTGVNVLLQGVVTDNNKARREAVRRKTAQYLMKAEDLYKKFLSAEAASANRWNSDKFHMEINHNSIHLRGSFDDLKNFKVIGIIDRVLLVLDMVSNQMFVIKVLQKCAVPSKKRKTCVPAKCRFMVQLCRYFETENAIYLVLEHATGGKLWDYASGYLRQEEDVICKQSTNSVDCSIGSRTSSRTSKRSRGNSVHEDFPVNEPAVDDVFDSTTGEKNEKDIHGISRLGSACQASDDNLNLELSVNRLPDLNSQTELTDTSPISDKENGNQDCASSYAELITDYSKTIKSCGVESTSKESSKIVTDLSVITDSTPSSDFSAIDESEDFSMSTLIEKSFQYEDSQTQNDGVSCGTEDHLDSVSSLPANNVTPKSQPPPMSLFSIDSLESPCEYSSPENGNVTNGRAFSFFSDAHNPGRTLNNIPEVSDASRKLDFGSCPDEEVFKATEVNKLFDNKSVINSHSVKPPSLYMNNIDDDLPIVIDAYMHKPPDTRGFAVVMDSKWSSNSSSIDGDSSELLQSVDVKYDGEEKDEDDFLVIDLVDSAMNRADENDQNSTQRPELQTQTSRSNLNVSGMGKGCFPGIETNDQSEANIMSSELSTKDVLNLPQKTNSESSTEDKNFSVFVNPFEKYESGEPNGVKNQPQFKTWVSIEDSPNHKPAVTIPKGIPTPVCSPTRKTTTTTPLDLSKKDSTDTVVTKDLKNEHLNSDNSVGDQTLTNSGSQIDRKTLFSRERTMSALFENIDRKKSKGAVTLPESCVRVWIAEIILALDDLHSMGIICRDLNTSNILLGERGHIRLSYFSVWQYIENDLNESAMENFYSAPEVNGIYKVTPACDWWSVGALLFELLTGKSLHNCHPSGINSHTELKIPDHVSKEAKSLLNQLLSVNASERLGSGLSGADEIKVHPFFRDINWKTLAS
ncbi:ribosomal protein S6 kinase delta-1-like [Anneissia japonica]|uniref:ribosomal protein S6 kinase delta-1-like n=1 Tax=Anneissia japonica TaxID=1529436 RepID=UPI0014258652|nr:ribosomal protein S6 kinase delta-1-like [Anneissia japonica]